MSITQIGDALQRITSADGVTPPGLDALHRLDPERYEWARSVIALCEWARLAYNAYGGWRTDDANQRQRNREAGDRAGQYMAVWQHLRELSPELTRTSEVLAKVQKTSDWLKAHSFNGIPDTLCNAPGKAHNLYKTAQQMHGDMEHFVVEVRTIRAGDAAYAAAQDETQTNRQEINS